VTVAVVAKVTAVVVAWRRATLPQQRAAQNGTGWEKNKKTINRR